MTNGVADISSNPACVRVVARAYLKFFGSDVITCNTNAGAGGIFAYAKNAGAGYIGSSVQYAALAMGAIDGPGSDSKHGFFSNSLNAAANPTTLTFANTGVAGSFGGSLGGGTDNCSSNNYYTNEIADASVLARIEPSATINGLSIPDGTAAAPKVISRWINGDAYITGNIVYSNNGARASSDNIPSYRLIVRGNIYINNNVTELDGFYFAGGTIYTCVTGFNTTFPGYGNCGNPLKVYGAMQANDTIKLWRTSSVNNGTLAKATTNENSPTNCALIGSSCNNIAETFIFSPEMYLGAWSAPATTGIGQSDSIKSLPPRF
jgi:hypothetical protein